MQRRLIKIVGIGCVLALAACRGKHDGGGFGGGGGGGANAEATLNGNMILPPGSYTLTDPPTDETITVTGGGASTPPPGGLAATTPGAAVPVGIQFNAPNANIVGAGIRIGTTGPINVVPIAGATGQTSGTLSFMMGVPPDICGDLSSICHNILCYEFAVTSAGTISRANINALALQCGNCEEPSCQQLLTSCEGCTAGQFDCGDGSCIAANQVCNSTSNCANGSDEDPGTCGDQGNCCVATDGCPDETGSSCGATCCCCPGGQACCADQSGCCST